MKKKTILLSILMNEQGNIMLKALFIFLMSTTFLFAADGDLDPSFTTQTTNLKSQENIVKCSAIDSNGKLLSAGYSRDMNNQNFMLMRYNTNGVLDTDFGYYGQVITDTGATQESINDIAIQNDGKIVVAGYLGSGLVVMRYNSNGVLDSTFGVNGIVDTISFGSKASASALAIDSDGKIIVTATIGSSGNYNVGIARLLNNGILDTTFDSDGKVYSDVSDGNDFVNDMVVQTDNKIVITGQNAVGDYLTARYNTNGALDTTFDGDGIKTQSIAEFDSAQSLVVQADGKIIVVGKSYSVDHFNLAMVRYNADGSDDTSFGQNNLNNIVISTMSSDDNPSYRVALLSDGIVVSGNQLTGNNRDMAIAFYNANGLSSLVGIVVASTTYLDDNAYSISVNTNGAEDIIYVVGKATDENLDAILVSYHSNGALNSNFIYGAILTDVNSQDYAYDVAIQKDQKIVLVGKSDDDIAIVRYDTNSNLDSTFNSTGIVILDINGIDSGNAVSIQNDGKIVIVGHNDEDAVVVRLNSDGSLDSSFNSTGILITDFSSDGSSIDEANDVVIQSDGKIVILGSDGKYFILKRYNSDGSQDLTFTSLGRVELYGGTGSFASSLSLHPDHSFVIGGGELC